LAVAIGRKTVNWRLDADPKGFFDSRAHDDLITFMECRIADQRILPLIKKWLKVEVVVEEDTLPKVLHPYPEERFNAKHPEKIEVR
jgi:retron-type reverse transcriptase